MVIALVKDRVPPLAAHSRNSLCRACRSKPKCNLSPLGPLPATAAAVAQERATAAPAPRPPGAPAAQTARVGSGRGCSRASAWAQHHTFVLPHRAAGTDRGDVSNFRSNAIYMVRIGKVFNGSAFGKI
eukprot:gene17267-biopygen20361